MDLYILLDVAFGQLINQGQDFRMHVGLRPGDARCVLAGWAGGWAWSEINAWELRCRHDTSSGAVLLGGC